MIDSVDGYFLFDDDIMPNSPVVVEIGAYSSNSVWEVKKKYPSARMFVVEAHPANFKALNESLYVPHEVVTLNVALAKTDGPVDFYEFDFGRESFSVFERSNEPEMGARRRIVVEGARLSRILKKLGIENVDYLMLNCEGAEIFALEELLEDGELRGRIGQITLGFHCKHVHIFSQDVMNDLLKRLAEYYNVTAGNYNLAYYLFIRKDLEKPESV